MLEDQVSSGLSQALVPYDVIASTAPICEDPAAPLVVNATAVPHIHRVSLDRDSDGQTVLTHLNFLQKVRLGPESWEL
eukprot:8521619-Lingulodinium_polyedra.AAC.1